VAAALPPWVPGEETKPAPGPLLVVQAFVNTWDSDRNIELLGDVESGERWFAQSGLLGAGERLTPAALERARGVREAIRALLIENAGGPGPTHEQLGLIADVAGAGSLRLQLAQDRSVQIDPSTAAPIDAVLLRVLLIVRDAQHDGTWARLKACGREECLWAFYDRSHSQRGKWCDMAACGNREKNRALRARRRG
jgi:predicted RNA-binding Zn ribbon-like protein